MRLKAKKQVRKNSLHIKQVLKVQKAFSFSGLDKEIQSCELRKKMEHYCKCSPGYSQRTCKSSSLFRNRIWYSPNGFGISVIVWVPEEKCVLLHSDQWTSVKKLNLLGSWRRGRADNSYEHNQEMATTKGNVHYLPLGPNRSLNAYPKSRHRLVARATLWNCSFQSFSKPVSCIFSAVAISR